MRKILKILFCDFVFYIGILPLYIKCVFAKGREFSVVIINYHSFRADLNAAMETDPTVDIQISEFVKQIKFLKKYFDVRPLDEIVAFLKEGRKFSRPTVAITIDDGYQNNYALMQPVLAKYDIPGTVFLTTGVVNTNGKIWTKRLADTIEQTSKKSISLPDLTDDKTLPLCTVKQKRCAYQTILQKLKNIEATHVQKWLEKIEHELGIAQNAHRTMLNWDEIKMMNRHKISFGAHTVNHPILTKMPFEEAKREILNSKNEIEQKLSVVVHHFAYTNGRPQDFNAQLRQFCKEAGFKSISTCDYGCNGHPDDVWALKRIGSKIPVSLFAFDVIRAFHALQ